MTVNAPVALGWRLALRAGASRAVAVIGCSALGLTVLLFCVDFPQVAHDPASLTQDRFLFQFLTAVVALPVVVLVAATSRLSADTRDRRLTLLRLLGVSPARCGVVAAVETGLLVLAGGLIGVIVHAVAQHGLWSALLRRGVGHQQPETAVGRDLLIALSAAVAVSVVAARPAVRSGSGLLEARRVRPHGRGTHVLAVLGVVGLIIAGVLAAWPTPQNDYGAGGEGWRVIAMGVALVSIAAGLVALTQVALGALARYLRGRSSGSALVTAGRLDGDRAAIGRAVGGLTVATFVAAFGLSIFTIFTTTPQYRSAAWNLTHEQVNLAAMDSGFTQAQLTGMPGITKVEAVGRYEPKDFMTSMYPEALSLTCTQVRALASAPKCSDSEPWVAVVDGGGGQGKPALRGDFVLAKGRSVKVDASFAAPVTTRSAPGGSGNAALSLGTVMIIPPAWAAAHGGTTNAFLVTAEPGAREPLGPGTSYLWSDYDQVENYRQLTYLLIGVVMSIGLLTVVVTTLDMLAERRRRVAGLRMMGIPAPMLRRSQFAAVIIPLAVGLCVAVLAGLLMGRGYLNFAGEAQATPWAALVVLLGSALAAAVVLAAATTAGLGRPLTADLLRRE